MSKLHNWVSMLPKNKKHCWFSHKWSFWRKNDENVLLKTALAALVANFLFYFSGGLWRERLNLKCVKLLFWVSMQCSKNNANLVKEWNMVQKREIAHTKKLWQPRLFEIVFGFIWLMKHIKCVKLPFIVLMLCRKYNVGFVKKAALGAKSS